MLQQADVNIILRNCNIDKNRYCSKLNNRCNSSRKSCRNSNNLVTAVHGSIAKQWRCQRHKSNKICGRTRINERAILHTKIFRQLLFKHIGISSGREPEFKRAVNKIYHLRFIIDASRIRNPVANVKIIFSLVKFDAVFRNHFEYLLSCLIFGHILKHRHILPYNLKFVFP